MPFSRPAVGVCEMYGIHRVRYIRLKLASDWRLSKISQSEATVRVHELHRRGPACLSQLSCVLCEVSHQVSWN